MSYPATSLSEAVDLVINTSNTLHEVINGAADEEIITDTGPVPSLRKALVDNFYFKDPVDWDEGSNETVFNQLRLFSGNTMWYAPAASATTLIPMGESPVGDDNWVVFTADSDSAEEAIKAADRAELAAAAAELSEESAATSETNAASSALAASNSASEAATSESNADNSQANAATSEANAALSEANAKTSETNAAASALAASTSETNASASETAAKTSETNAKTSETNAKASETASATSEANAAASETSANNSATAAALSESNAGTSEDNAALSASSASASAATATTKAGEASTSASNAATSESNAATSASNAATSASNASTSETNAEGFKNAAEDAATAASASEVNAKASETASAASASAASTSETNAETSEDNAAASATAASGSASAASTSAGQAASSASAASTSETNAGNSATAAAGSASTALSHKNAAEDAQTAAEAAQAAAELAQTAAKTSETNSKASENAAAASEANAATSESNAAGSASSASTSATNASNSATAAGNSATAASGSATSAANSATAADASDTSAEGHKNAAAASAAAAQLAETNAETAETNAVVAKTAAETAQSEAEAAELAAKTSETNAGNSASGAATSEANASASADLAEDWAVGYPTNSAMYWAEQAQIAANSSLVFGDVHTPTAGNEYPDITGVQTDTLYIISFSTAGQTYTFTGGDLVGITVRAGDQIIYRDDEDLWRYVKSGLEAAVTTITTVTGVKTGAVTLSANDFAALTEAESDAKYFSQTGGTIVGSTNINANYLAMNGNSNARPSWHRLEASSETTATYRSDAELWRLYMSGQSVIEADASGFVSIRDPRSLTTTQQTGASSLVRYDYLTSQLSNKFDKSGGNITGDTNIDGKLTSDNVTTGLVYAREVQAHNNKTWTASLLSSTQNNASLLVTKNSSGSTVNFLRLASDNLFYSPDNLATYKVFHEGHYPAISEVTGLQTALDGKLGATSNAVSASKLATARTISLAGDATGSTSFDGSANATITVTVKDDSHSHVISNVDGLQTALNGKLGVSANAASATKFNTAQVINLTGDLSGTVTFDGSEEVTQAITVVNNSHSHTISNVTGLQDALDAKLDPSGNAATATKLATARTIGLSGDASGSASFDGSANATITVTVKDDSHNHVIANVDGLQTALNGKLGTTANAASATKLNSPFELALSGDATGSVDIDGSGDVTLAVTVANNSHTHTIANVTGLQTALDGKLGATANAVSASKLATARTITFGGDVNGSYTFDGASNETVSITVKDDSHNHVISNIDGLQTALNGKLNTGDNAVSATKLQTARNINLTGDATGSASFDGTANANITVDVPALNDKLDTDGGAMTGPINWNTWNVGKRFTMLDAVGTQYILICRNAGNNNVNGRFQWERTSGNYQSQILDVIVSSGSSTPAEGTLTQLARTQENETVELVTCTHNSLSWIAIKYSGNAYPATQAGFFSGYHQSTGGSSIPVVADTEVSDVAPLSTTRSKWTRDGARVFTEDFHPNADKLTTARTIAVTGDVEGAASFDGTSNVAINANLSQEVQDQIDLAMTLALAGL